MGKLMERSCRHVIIRGVVSSGAGEGRKFTSLPWFKRQVKEILGFEPYPGTLNLIVNEDSNLFRRIFLSSEIGYRIFPEGNYFPGILYRAVVASAFPGGVIRPCISKYPINLVEIISPICLRRMLNLRNGDEVEVKVFFK